VSYGSYSANFCVELKMTPNLTKKVPLNWSEAHHSEMNPTEDEKLILEKSERGRLRMNIIRYVS